MPFQSVPRPRADRTAADAAAGTTHARLTAGNRTRGLAIVDELSRITEAMAAGRPTTSAEIVAVADRIAALRSAVRFTGLVGDLDGRDDAGA